MRNKPIKNEVMSNESLLKKSQDETERYRKEIDKLNTQLEQVHIIIRVVMLPVYPPRTVIAPQIGCK